MQVPVCKVLSESAGRLKTQLGSVRETMLEYHGEFSSREITQGGLKQITAAPSSPLCCLNRMIKGMSKLPTPVQQRTSPLISLCLLAHC